MTVRLSLVMPADARPLAPIRSRPMDVNGRLIQGVQTVSTLAGVYGAWAKAHYTKGGRATGHGDQIAHAVNLLCAAGAGGVSLAHFGPRMLLEFQRVLAEDAEQRWGLKTINLYVSHVVGMFAWGVSREIVPVETLTALKTVRPLRRGRAPAPGVKPPRPPVKIKPVPASALELTRRHVSAMIRDMIDIQVLTAMRPTELVSMRLSDLYETDDPDVVYYRVAPDANKVEHHGLDRVVAIGPRTLKILAPYIARARALDPDRAYLFRPCDAHAEWLREKHESRKTPLSCGNAPGTNRRGNPMWAPGEKYTPASYRKAIARGCERAGVPAWSPNRLRHNGATAIASRVAIEVAKEQLGHTSIATTAGYVEPDRGRLTAWAREHA